MRIMAVDYGDARTGVAISDVMGILVGQTCVVSTWDRERAAQQVAQIAQQAGVQEIVVGFPKNMDGSDGARAEIYRAFAVRLSELTGMEPILWDERRTTIDAHRILSENGRKGKEHRKNVDAVAASLILETYLRFRENRE